MDRAVLERIGCLWEEALRRIGAAFFTVVLVTGQSGFAHAQPQAHLLLEEPGITILGDGAWEKEGRYLREVFPGIVGELEEALGWKLHTQPRVLLVGRKETFEQMTDNPLVSAFAVPSQGLIALHLSPAGSQRPILRETFSHELCHLLLHENIREDLLPKWLDEGICQWVSGSLGEVLAGEGIETTAMDMVRSPIPFHGLHRVFPRDRHGMLLAYAQSRSVVEYLNSRFGKEGIQVLLRELREGRPLDQALQTVFGLPWEELEKEWLRTVTGSRAWFLWLSGHLYDLLFFTAAILSVLAFLRTWLRKRKFPEAEEED